MKNFFRKLSYLTPILLFFLIPVLIILMSGENISTDNIVLYQAHSPLPSLIGLAYSDPTNYYKLESLKHKNYDIISIGSSRIMQFRANFFNKKSNFFNGGMRVPNIKYLNLFLHFLLKTNKPKIILLGLDQYLFNVNYPMYDDTNIINELHGIYSPVWNIETFKKIWLDIFLNKIQFQKLIFHASSKVGINAIMNSNGYENDGSRLYGKTITNPEKSYDFMFKDTLFRINEQKSPFQSGTNISDSAINELNKLLNDAKQNNIYIIGIFPPFAPSIYKTLISKKMDYSYLLKLNSVIAPIFNKYNYPLFDYTDPSGLNTNDLEFLDGFHGSDKVYLRIILDMAKMDITLRSYIDIPNLEEILKNLKTDLQVYEFVQYQ